MHFEGTVSKMNKKDFRKLFDKYFPSLCLFASKILVNICPAEDIVQEVFVKIWKSNTSFPNESALKAYLYVSTRNRCIDFVRKEKSLKYIEDFDSELSSEEILDEVVQTETYRLLSEAIDCLGEQSKKIIQLSFYAYSNKEIAEELNISIHTVKTLKYRSLNRLREILDCEFSLLILLCLKNFF